MLQGLPQVARARHLDGVLSELPPPERAVVAGAAGRGFELRRQLITGREAAQEVVGVRQAKQERGAIPERIAPNERKRLTGGRRRRFVPAAHPLAIALEGQDASEHVRIGQALSDRHRLVDGLPRSVQVRWRHVRPREPGQQEGAFPMGVLGERAQPARQRQPSLDSQPAPRVAVRSPIVARAMPASSLAAM